ncbi:hypothetical protein [Saccharothrix variisporea]|uniref:Carboxypeptidase regulatory-like domain-containing protein n=1 Tax=Saccharothrix variisporea TaxID=543527 RepID=A0A495XN84_9PSEU|nr:hypothetical protein [Saccharothrix variisporea]RKT74366.1 hypothetical protein DFJ66_7711 [Saccharothrix variisporea]
MRFYEEVLGRLHDLWAQIDPAPPDLADRTAFAFDFTTAHDEIARAVRHPRVVGARGDAEARLITFTGARLTIVLSLTVKPGGMARLDGWIIPASAHLVELRTAQSVQRTSSDGNGRFSFPAVDHAVAQLAVRIEGASAVTTPAIEL